MEITAHCFIDNFTMVAITINTKATNFFLCSWSVVTLNFALRAGCLKVWHDHIFKRSNSIFSSLEFLFFFIVVPSRTQASGHILTLKIRTELTSIKSNDWFTQVVWFSKKRFVCYWLPFKNNWGTTGHIFPNFCQTSHYHSKRMGKTNIWLTCVNRYSLNSVMCSRALTCLSLFHDKIQSFSA